MLKSNWVTRLLSDIQIQSALIWAFTVLVASYFKDTDYLPVIIGSAATVHITLMTRHMKQRG